MNKEFLFDLLKTGSVSVPSPVQTVIPEVADTAE